MSEAMPINPVSHSQEPDLSSLRPLICLARGLDEAWIEQRLKPILERANDLVTFSEETEPKAGEAPPPPEAWDILIAGEAAATAGSFAAFIQELGQNHALAGIVAILAAGPQHPVLPLYQAGAREVVAADCPDEALEEALGRTIAACRQRLQQVEAEKMRVIAQLAVSVNHEINNPLAGLMGTAELMARDNPTLDDKGRKDLQTIVGQCRRIQEITSRLKQLNHIRTVPYGQHDRMIDLASEPHNWRHEPQSGAQQFLETPKVLIVDDNPLIVDLIERMFEQRYEIHACTCASDALALLQKEDMDLALIDLILPEMNGLELFREMRRIRPEQKVILTTAYQGDARVEQALQEGALGCIYKPFQLEDLEKALEEAMKN